MKVVPLREYYSDSDSLTCQLSELQSKIRVRPFRPESRLSLLWGFAINAVLWLMIGGGSYWIWRVFR